MGQKKARKKRLLEEQPFCCFCGGAAPSAGEDHIPPRSFFIGRERPEGYSFGACQNCNSESRLSELVAAFYARWMDHEEANLIDAELQKLWSGMKNNHPELLPRTDLSETEIAKALSQISETFTHFSLGPPPVVAIPKGATPHLTRFARKLTCALRYKETGTIVPPTANLWTHWTHYHDRRLPDLMQTLDKSLPVFRVGTRSSRELTSQFKYVCGVGEDGKLFAFLAQFGKSIIVLGAVYDGIVTDQRMKHWKSLSSLLESERLLDGKA